MFAYILKHLEICRGFETSVYQIYLMLTRLFPKLLQVWEKVARNKWCCIAWFITKYIFVLMASQNFLCCSLCPFVLISAFKSLLLQNQWLHLSSVKQCAKIFPVMGLGMSTTHRLSGNPRTWHLHMSLAVFFDGFCSLCPALLPCLCQACHVLHPYLKSYGVRQKTVVWDYFPLPLLPLKPARLWW